MKKSLLSIVCLLFIDMAVFAQPTSSVLLQHEGNVEVYSIEALNDALQDAVDGDTLFLSKGVYSGFTIDKKITVRGAGEETVVKGDIFVNIPGTPTLSSTLLEGVLQSDYSGVIYVQSPVNGMKLKQCAFYQLNYDATVYDAVIDRCLCSGVINIPGSVKSLKIVESKIMECNIKEESSVNISVINTTLRGFRNGQNFRGTVINSIVGWPGNTRYTYASCSFINSLLSTYRLTIGETCYVENCWMEEDQNLVKNPAGNSFWAKYSEEELLEKGYIGNDGTIVGCYGGSTPFTLILPVPKVLSSEVDLDNEKRQLNVKLTLTAE